MFCRASWWQITQITNEMYIQFERALDLNEKHTKSHTPFTREVSKITELFREKFEGLRFEQLTHSGRLLACLSSRFFQDFSLLARVQFARSLVYAIVWMCLCYCYCCCCCYGWIHYCKNIFNLFTFNSTNVDNAKRTNNNKIITMNIVYAYWK